MGCDIHMFLEYSNKQQVNFDDKREPYWYSFVEINPGRNYNLFAKLSGVRAGSFEDVQPLATPGWPSNPGYRARMAHEMVINDKHANANYPGYVTMEMAQRWVNSRLSTFVYDKDNLTPVAVTTPYWHSYGHCDIATLAKALKGNSTPEYRALLAAARELAKTYNVRFLFFYDN